MSDSRAPFDRPALAGRDADYDSRYFGPLAAAEDRHFWFRARKRVFAPLVRQLTAGRSTPSRVLEVGCGQGSSLELLERACAEGTVFGFDFYLEGLLLARSRTHCPLVQGDLRAAPFGVPFDLICLFDVLEHLEDDLGALRDLRSLLAPGGALLLTVPAGPSLWSYFDVGEHHKRRYRADELGSRLVESGFRVEYLTPYMASLFPIVWIGRRLAPFFGRLGSRPGSEFELVTDELRVPFLLNALLGLALAPESALIARRRHLPFGTSYLAIARNGGAKPETSASPETILPRRPR